ncbi:hypothetical protein [Aquimarina algicola]|uniref:Lipocalin-like domain-containing protein n=1 Tax=Aquimarina algicola TaxID=2589995 RepID=A0A504J912_9FLAO|nr:hypothetical protein [Aquimarina algicola]TPN83529.1 hypothetical protein FHK87_20135 [Aquimarina algicola]
MKTLQLYLCLSICMAIISCSSDDSDSNSGDLTSVESNPQEETVLEASLVSKGISVRGAERKAGTPPTPNGNISFTLENNENQSAFLNSGFDIDFNAPDSYAGAYLQIKSGEETAADYLDIPRDALFRSASNNKRFLKSGKEDEGEFGFDVDFSNDIPPGKFCYIICIYDDNGNISNPVEVCVEVEAWGGNINFAGDWNYTKQIENDNTTISLGEEECDNFTRTISCTDSTESVTVDKDYCTIIDSLIITFNEDGTYEYTTKDRNTRIDFNATQDACSAVYTSEEKETYMSKGKWAYDEEEKKLTLVEFEYIIRNETTQEVEEGLEEDGDLVFDGTITLSGSEFTLKEVYTDGDETESYEYFFEKR